MELYCNDFISIYTQFENSLIPMAVSAPPTLPNTLRMQLYTSLMQPFTNYLAAVKTLYHFVAQLL